MLKAAAWLLIGSGLTLTFLGGCDDDPLERAENLIADYRFSEALDVLDELESAPVDSIHYHCLRALALFVEGRSSDGFAEIRSLHASIPEADGESARTMLKAARVVVREKSRVREAIALLDSALVGDPGLKDEVLRLAWTRGVEYLSCRGDAGYQLMQFTIERDPLALGRLRGFNPNLAERYAEMETVKRQLDGLAARIDSFRARYGRDPRSLAELVRTAGATGMDTSRAGWRFALRWLDGELRVTAESKINRPHGVPWPTMLRAP